MGRTDGFEQLIQPNHIESSTIDIGSHNLDLPQMDTERTNDYLQYQSTTLEMEATNGFANSEAIDEEGPMTSDLYSKIRNLSTKKARRNLSFAKPKHQRLVMSYLTGAPKSLCPTDRIIASKNAQEWAQLFRVVEAQAGDELIPFDSMVEIMKKLGFL